MRRIFVVLISLLLGCVWPNVTKGSQEPGNYSNGRGIVSVDTDKWVSWSGPSDSTVFIQVDDETPAFFASGSAGVQGAPWMTEGHVYTFILQDVNGSEI